jgi:hypothetical protein
VHGDRIDPTPSQFGCDRGWDVLVEQIRGHAARQRAARATSVTGPQKPESSGCIPRNRRSA